VPFVLLQGSTRAAAILDLKDDLMIEDRIVTEILFDICAAISTSIL
jgi:hypothetical protein